MRAQSIRNPWAWALAAGHKPVENRKTPLWKNQIDKWTLIHSGVARPTHALVALVEQLAGPMPEWAATGPGAIVGALRYERCLTNVEAYENEAFRPWVTEGGYCYVVGDAVLFEEDEHIPLVGRQTLFWDVGPELTKRGMELIARRR